MKKTGRGDGAEGKVAEFRERKPGDKLPLATLLLCTVLSARSQETQVINLG